MAGNRQAIALIAGLMTRPEEAWRSMHALAPTAGWIAAALVAPLAAVVALAWSTGILLTPLRPQASPAFLITLITTFVLCFAAIAMLALAMAALLPMYERPRDWHRSWLVAAGSATPMLLSGALLFYPMFIMVMVIATPYAAFLVFLGAQQMLGVAPADATEFTAASMLTGALASVALGGVMAAIGLV